LLEMAEKAAAKRKGDPAKVKEMVSELEKEFEARWRAIYQLVGVGEFAVPYLLNYLSEAYLTEKSKQWVGTDWTDQTRQLRKEEIRSAALVTLRKLDREAVAPLIAGLNGPDPEVRRDAAILLAQAGDFRAVAALHTMACNPKETEEVRKVAADAVAKIVGLTAVDLKPEERYYELAEKFYYEDAKVMPYFFDERVTLWAWTGEEGGKPGSVKYEEKTVSRLVPRFAYNELMAEQACFDGLRVNPQHEPLIPLLLAVTFAQLNEADAILVGQAKAPAGAKLSEAAVKEVQERRAKLEKALLIAQPAGKKHLYSVLDRAMRDKNAALAMSCIQALRRLGDSSPEVGEGKLVEALNFPDRKVRYAAAEALTRIAPNGALGGAKRVVSVLGNALSELTARTVMFFDTDGQVRNRLKTDLAALGYWPVEAADKQACLEKARAGFPPVDLALIASDAKDTNLLELLNTFNKDVRLRHVAVVLLAADPKAAEGPAANLIQGCVPKNVSKDDLGKALPAAFAKKDVPLDPKTEAVAIVQAIVTAVADLNPKTTSYPLAELTPTLIRLLQNHPDPIRLQAIRALGNLANPAGMDGLRQVFCEAKNPKELRLAALQGMGRIILEARAVSAEDCALLRKTLNDGDADLRAAAAAALGRAALGPEQVGAVLREQRIR